MRLPPGLGLNKEAKMLLASARCLRVGLSALALCIALPQSAQAQSSSFLEAGLPKTSNDPNAQMLLQADDLTYDNDNKTVSANGNVQIFYNGYNVLAEQVTYNKESKRLIANGKVRITDPSGNIYHTESADLTQDFGDGFVKTLRLERTDRTRFAADSAERQGGNVTILNRGVYTACEPCKNNPEKPPLWQVKAARIIQNQKEQTIYYEDATLEFLGVPIAYVPYFWSPDGSVKRKSGFLSPDFFYNRRIGHGVAMPYYFALSPFYDLTFTPTLTTPQGPHLDFLWRHSLPNGSYSFRASGIYQLDPDNVGTGRVGPPANWDEGARTFRGALQTTGRFLLTDKWTLGWDLTLDSDQRYLKDYGYTYDSDTENISTFYLQGIGDRSFFDARSYYVRSLVTTDVLRDRQGFMPWVLPVVDYNTSIPEPYLGGEFKVDANFTSVRREDQMSYFLAGAGPRPNKYFTQGFAGDYTRFSTEASWRKTFTDPAGQRFTPFASLRGDVYTFNVSNSALFPLVDVTTQTVDLVNTNTYASTIPGLVADDGEIGFRAMPTLGVDYRYPFIGTMGDTTHIIEPIAQVILRPNETNIGMLPNEDSQSLVFDDTTLFETDKFSGYDRIEGGSRLNAGMQYTLQHANGFLFSALFGQSYQLGGLNSFDQGLADIAGTGLDSGLETRRSDYVARLYFQPWQYGDVSARFRFDERECRCAASNLMGDYIMARSTHHYHTHVSLRSQILASIQIVKKFQA